jgi:teichuronic acid biosynthesis glycosyltransferase TuaH
MSGFSSLGACAGDRMNTIRRPLPRMLYFAHIPWDWVRQRPQHLADALASYYSMTVLSPFIFRHRNQLRRGYREPSTRYRAYLHLPYYQRSRLTGWLDSAVMRAQIAWWILVWRPDVIWVSYAELVRYLPRRVKAILVYDCMDDFAEFPALHGQRDEFLAYEKRLMAMSSVVCVSSQHLLGILRKRYAVRPETILVRNACPAGMDSALKETPTELVKQGVWHIMYFGTLSHLDWESIRSAIDSLDDVVFDLFGPAEGVCLPVDSSRIKWHGIVSHAELSVYASQAACLAFPFAMSPLVDSVDPVKLYEYVGFGKPIISVRYSEVERFAPFVEFYSSPHEFVDVLQKMIDGGFQRKYTAEQRSVFLRDNSWLKRAEVVKQTLDNIMDVGVVKQGRRV